MKTPLVLLLLSIALCCIGLLVPGWSDLLLLGLPCVLASLWLVWRARQAVGVHVDEADAKPRAGQKWAIIDGSNVMHWYDGSPDIQPVRDAIAVLTRKGFRVGVMFDANAGYKLWGRYKHDDAFSAALGLSQDRVMVVPKGTPADPYILKAARDYGARIVTNDRFRDWAKAFPEVRTRGFLITGRYTGTKLSLAMGERG